VPAILGDAIHNLRAALDHAYCILVQANNGTVTRRTLFPFGGDPQSIKGSIDGHKPNTPVEAVIDFIVDEIQPYDGGKFGLYGLHKLDITDKHQILIPTTKTAHIENLMFVHKDGRVFPGITGLNVIMPNRPGLSTIAIAPGADIKFHKDSKVTFSVCFDKGQPFGGNDVIQTLDMLAQNVASALTALEALII
jgi:hypothetical protein